MFARNTQIRRAKHIMGIVYEKYNDDAVAYTAVNAFYKEMVKKIKGSKVEVNVGSILAVAVD